MKIKRICQLCGKEYYTRPYLAPITKYCSMLCLNRANSRISASRKGPRHWNWKGGLSHDAEGYLRAQAPEHPSAHGNGQILFHRLVLERKLGRPLRTDEVSHHIDLDKSNNDPGNLAPMGRGDHSRYHANLEYLFEHLLGA